MTFAMGLGLRPRTEHLKWMATPLLRPLQIGSNSGSNEHRKSKSVQRDTYD